VGVDGRPGEYEAFICQRRVEGRNLDRATDVRRDETVQQRASSSEITTWATDLKKALSSGSAYIRLGWEFNGDWFPWGVKPGDAAAFKSCWIKWYTLVKRVATKFELVWNPYNQSSDARLDVRDFWPGGGYVDATGPDAYALSVNGN